MNLESILIIASSFGIVTILLGIYISKYPREGSYIKLNDMNMEFLINTKYLKKLLNFLTSNKKSVLYRFSAYSLKKSETFINIKIFYLIKIVTVIIVLITLALVRYTNIDAMKTSIIGKLDQTYSLFDNGQDISKDYAYNLKLYQSVVKSLGENKLKKLTSEQKIEMIKEQLKKYMETNDQVMLQQKAEAISKTFSKVENIRLLNWNILIAIILAWFLPEVTLMIKSVVLGSKYKREVIKLENIFELLADIKGFNTLDILNEMAKASKIYSKHIRYCISIFETDKDEALDRLKLLVTNNRFGKLVDTLRIYSRSDKVLALNILERSKQEKEEEIIMTANEDMDTIDIVALVSIAPVIYNLAFLLLEPQISNIKQAFQFI